MTLNNVQCSGTEARLLDCLSTLGRVCNSYNGLAGVQCYMPTGTGVLAMLYHFIITCYCTDCSHGDVRLVGGRNSFEGRVEVCYAGVWGTVCSNSWGTVDASVVCGQHLNTSLGLCLRLHNVMHNIEISLSSFHHQKMLI